jgi:hypothetical protein
MLDTGYQMLDAGKSSFAVAGDFTPKALLICLAPTLPPCSAPGGALSGSPYSRAKDLMDAVVMSLSSQEGLQRVNTRNVPGDMVSGFLQ